MRIMKQLLKMNILVYFGKGTSPGSIHHTIATLKTHLSDNYDIIKIDTKILLTAHWTSTTSLLVIPGGRDLPYVADLNGEGTKIIQQYVKNGGSYLGICAGAYFAGSFVKFEVDRPEYKVIGERKLSLIDVASIGSVSSDFVYNSESGAKAIPLEVAGEMGHVNVYVNGGGYFEFNGESPNVIASYILPNETNPSGSSKKLPGKENP